MDTPNESHFETVLRRRRALEPVSSELLVHWQVNTHEWERLRELERRGEIRLGAGRLPTEFWDMPRPNDPEASVRSAILDEREEGR